MEDDLKTNKKWKTTSEKDGNRPKNKHKFVQKDAKVAVLDIIMSLIEQSCAELGEKSWLPLTTLDSL